MASGNLSPAAAMFSSTCATEDVPGIGSIVRERFRSHARATCNGFALRSFATLIQDVVGLAVLPEWRPGDEGDAVLLAVVEQEIPFAIGKAIAILNRDDGDDFAGALQMFKGHIRESNMLDFAGLAEAGEGFHRCVKGDSGIGNVELVNADAIEAKTLQAALDGFFQMPGTGIVNPLAGPDALPSAFGGDHQAIG